MMMIMITWKQQQLEILFLKITALFYLKVKRLSWRFIQDDAIYFFSNYEITLISLLIVLCSGEITQFN